MKIRRKLSSLITLTVYLLSIFVSLLEVPPTVFADDTGAITLELRNTDAGGRTEYLTGEKISTSIVFTNSGQEPINGTLRIKVKAEHLADNLQTNLFRKPVSALTGSTEWYKGEANGYYFAEYTIANFAGGTTLSIPLGFSLKQGTTPQNYQTDVVAEFESDANTANNQAQQLVFTSKIQPAQFYHYVERISGNGNKSRKITNGKSVLESGVTYPKTLPVLPTNTPNDDSTWARYIIGLDSSSNTYGNYIPQTATITYKLPVGSRLRGSGSYVTNDNSQTFSWLYDASTHTATYTGPLSGANTAYIELDFPDRPYADIHTSIASMVTDPGTVNQFDYANIEEHVKWIPSKPTIPAPPPGGTNGHFMLKIIREGTGPNRQGHGGGPQGDNQGVVWQPSRTSLQVALGADQSSYHNTKNTLVAEVSDTNPVYTYVDQLIEQEIDSRLYFHSWGMYANRNNNNLKDHLAATSGYDVYGIKATGEEVLLANDVKVGSGTIIDPDTGLPDVTGKFVKLRFVFEQPYRMGIIGKTSWSADQLNIHLTTPVKPSVWESWTVDDLVYADSRSGDAGAPPENSSHRMYASANFFVHYAGANGENPTASAPLTANGRQAIWWLGPGRNGYPRVSTFYKATRTEVGSWTGEPQELVTSTGQPDDAFMIKGDIDVLNPNDSSRLPLKNAKLITLLPQGLEFVPGSETNGMAGKAQVIVNYKGTGLTAVIIPFDDVVWDPTNNGNVTGTSATWHANKVERYVEFKVNPTEYLEYGENLVKQYLVWDNNTDVLPPADLTRTQKQPYTDTIDLDNDGDTAEVFLEGINKVIYNPPLGVTLRKYVSSDKTLWSPKVSELLDIDSEFFYKIVVSNRLSKQVDNISVVDVLPFVGDKRIVANQQGAYPNRNSQFRVNLTNSVESLPENAAFLSKWDVLYSTDDQGNTTDATVNSNFVPAASITNWSDVKMIKFVMKPGTVLTASDVSEAILPSKVPNRGDLNLFAKANNTAALKVPAILDRYLEGSTVSAQVARYSVTGVAFHDVNKDGDKDRTEPVLSGYTVSLMNQADDTPVLDPVTGQTVTAVTDAKGIYKMDVFKRGQYYIKVSKKEAIETFTRLYEEGGKPKPGTSSVKDGVIGNDTSEIDTTAGRTAAFDLNPSVIPSGLEAMTKAQQSEALAGEDNTLLAIRNIGFDNVNVNLDITVQKVWDDANNQDGKRPNSITVNLLANGTKVDTATISDNAGTWSHTFKDKPKYNNGREIVYTVEEETVTGYTPAVTGTATTGFTITNSYTPEVVDVPVKKVWNDANNQDGKRPADLAVILTKTVDGVTSDTTHTTTLSGTGNEWTHTFTGLPKYEAGKLITYGVKEVTVPTGYTSRVTATTITNTYTPETIAVTGTKTWNDANNQDGKRPASITINLLADGVEVQERVVTEATGWTYEFTNLPKYKDAGTEIVYSISEDAVAGYTTQINGNNVTNSYTPETTVVAGQKTWDDNDNQDGKRPASITVNLLADGVEVQEKVVTEVDGWAYSFTNLPKFKNGREVVYSITEDPVTLYNTQVTGFNITNTYSPEKVVVAGQKTWNDAEDQDGKRPDSIKVTLYADGVKKDSKTVSASEDWKYSFTDLPRYKRGVEIVYTIDEEVVADYTKTISGYNLTNSYTPETRSISGMKTWDDTDNQDGKRPTVITVRLLANGTEVASKQVSANSAGEWLYEFTDLPVYSSGQKITYTIAEDQVNDYTTHISDFDIANKHVPEKITVKGKKIWNDADDQDGKRPAKITVNLLADGKKIDHVLVDASTDWKYTFKDVPKYKDGQEIRYTVTEEAVAGYTTTIDGFDITNTYTPKVVTVSGKKVWKDNSDQDGIRPKEITVNLLANGEKVADVKVVADANDNWTYSFKDLPKFAKGKKIVYTVTENAVEGYVTTIKGTTITNTHKPDQTNLKVVKVWKDKDNQAKKRPDSITVQLVANGQEVKGKTVVLSAANNWEATFDDLAKNKNGVLIAYSVKEVSVPTGYTSTVEVKDGVATITNTYSAKGTPTKKLPKTGQSLSYLGFIGFALLIAVFYIRKQFEA